MTPAMDLDAERAVLGSVFLVPEVMDDVVTRIETDDFHDQAHRLYFTAMLDLQAKGKPIDAMVIRDQFIRKGQYEQAGGGAYLSKLLNIVPSAANAIFYADIVRDKAIRRNLTLAGLEAIREARDCESAEDAMAAAEAAMFKVSDRTVKQADTLQVGDIFRDVIGRLEAGTPSRETGVQTGYHEVDKYLGGMRAGELLILAGRPSMGKSALAFNIASNVAAQNQGAVMLVSLEMSSTEIADRLLLAESRYDGWRLRENKISADERRELIGVASRISAWPLYIIDTPTTKVRAIAAKARRTKRQKGGLALIVVDYLQLIEPDDAKVPRQEQVAIISRRLKALARELQVPVLCLAQLNRQTETTNDNRPKLSHLRESGAIEQDADVVMFTHRPAYYAAKKAGDHKPDRLAPEIDAEVIIAKQRNGDTGAVNLYWSKHCVRFDNPANKATQERYSEIDRYNNSDHDFT